MPLKRPQSQSAPTGHLSVLPIFEAEGVMKIPRHELPASGISADVAYQMLLDMGSKLDKDLVREFGFTRTLRLEAAE